MKIRIIPAKIRWVFGLILLVGAFRLFHNGTQPSEEIGAISGQGITVIGGLLAVLVAGIVLSPEVVDWVTIPFTSVFEDIVYPKATGIPPVDYKLARFYRKEERYDEALEQYFHVLEYHPEELTAYLEGMGTAFEGDEPDILEKLHRAGVTKLQTQAARDEVENTYQILVRSQAA